ncbi:GNAT family N-acetyltransferase [uncultured Xanthomonas sp.]|uniref:GNAT family N-acetyltransferase n=1 Tax=uncultured Xanthomonas sp. TaxID=152831 RepID=UPI0025E3E63A|nr:GNAT family N-acetyltransferase [uncultured Xanthomonas sp.]
MRENGTLDIRNAAMADRQAIVTLMAALDYAGTEDFIEARLTQLLAHPDAALLLAAAGDAVLGVLSLHFLPQLALAGDICRISYFCVDDRARGAGVGQRLLAEGEALARQRGSAAARLRPPGGALPQPAGTRARLLSARRLCRSAHVFRQVAARLRTV